MQKAIFQHKELLRSKLTDEEIADPALAFKKFFDGENIAEVHQHFDILREALFTEGYGELDSGDKWFVTHLMNGIEVIIDAGYIIYKGKVKNIPNRKQEEFEIERALYNPEYSDFEKVVTIIKAISQPATIFKIKSCPDSYDPKNSKYDFLVLLDGQREGYVEMGNRISEACENLGSVLITFRSQGDVVKGLKEGHILYSLTCTRENLVYEKEPGNLCDNPKTNIKSLIDNARLRFKTEFKKAQTFLIGANHFKSNSPDLNTCAFMLHQAIELAIRAVLIGSMEYWIYGHNLHIQLRHVHRFSEELPSILSNGSAPDHELLALVNQSYKDSRYNNRLNLNLAQASMLLEKITDFHSAIEQAFEERMQFYNQKFGNR